MSPENRSFDTSLCTSTYYVHTSILCSLAAVISSFCIREGCLLPRVAVRAGGNETRDPPKRGDGKGKPAGAFSLCLSLAAILARLMIVEREADPVLNAAQQRRERENVCRHAKRRSYNFYTNEHQGIRRRGRGVF